MKSPNKGGLARIWLKIKGSVFIGIVSNGPPEFYLETLPFDPVTRTKFAALHFGREKCYLDLILLEQVSKQYFRFTLKLPNKWSPSEGHGFCGKSVSDSSSQKHAQKQIKTEKHGNTHKSQIIQQHRETPHICRTYIRLQKVGVIKEKHPNHFQNR